MLHSRATSPVLIGRTAELQALEELLAVARGGRGAAAVIGGDAGVGKTRLCRELKASAAARGLRVIEGRCSPAETNVPYGPFIDALRFRLGKGESEEAADVLEPVLPHVAPLFAELAAAQQAVGRDPAATAAPFEHIFRVLQRLAGHGPVLLIIEDVHWADSTSRDLIQFICHRIATLPMVLVATYRTDEIHPSHPVHRVVAGIARDRAAVRVHLEPFDARDVSGLLGALLGSEPDPGFARAVAERTEGNPLFIEELLTVLRQAFPRRDPAFAAGDLAQISVPSSVNEMVWERLGPLDDDARQALTVAAVTGRRFRFDILAAALQWSEERLVTAIETLIEYGLLHELRDEDRDVYAFRHSLVQEVLYESTIGRRRRIWHLRVATALEQAGETEELRHTVLAHHYKLGGDALKAGAHMVFAGDEAARLCAWKDAEANYEQALAIVEKHGDASAEADILERMAEVAWWQNKPSSLEQYSSDALAIRRQLGDRERTALLLRRLANLEAYQHGSLETAIGRLTEALDLLEPTDHACSVILNDLGRLYVLRGDWSRAAALFERSLATSGNSRGCAEEALALVMLGWLAAHAGQVATATARLQLARSLIGEGDMPIKRAAEIYHAGIRALDATREHRLAAEWVDAARLYAQAHGAVADHAIYCAYGASVQRRAGDWTHAARQAEAAVAELRRMDRTELREALRIHGDLQRCRGQLEPARLAYQEAAALGETDALIGEALVLAAEQRWIDAAGILETALADAAPADALFAMRVLPILIESRAAAGELQQAERDLSRLRTLVRDSDYSAAPAGLAQAEAAVLMAAGDMEGAVVELRAALQHWQQLELPYEAARAALLLARAVAADDPAEAVALAEDAAQAFASLGATLDLGQAENLLRQLGVRGRKRRAAPQLPPPLDRLTPREADVFFELARGRTNKQIARTLSLSAKTVGNHVSSILKKLDCSTRTEAARLVAAAE